MRLLTYDYTSASHSQQLTIQVHIHHNDLTQVTCAYVSPSTKFTSEIWQPEFFQSLNFSIIGSSPKMSQKITQCLEKLSTENQAILKREYSSDDLIVSFYRGLSAYLIWLHLIEEHPDFFPQSVTIPHNLESGKSCNRHMFQYLSIYATALSTFQKDVCSKLVREVMRFLKCWEDFFIEGPIININDYTRLCMQIVTYCTEHTLQLQEEQLQLMRNYTKQLETNLGLFMLEHSTFDLQKQLQEQQLEIDNLKKQYAQLEYSRDSIVDLVHDIVPPKPQSIPKPVMDNAQPVAQLENILHKAQEMMPPEDSKYEPVIRDEVQTSLASNKSETIIPPEHKPETPEYKTETSESVKYVKPKNRKNVPWSKRGNKPRIISHQTETIRLSQDQEPPRIISEDDKYKAWESNFSAPSQADIIPQFKDLKIKPKVNKNGIKALPRGAERISFQRRHFTKICP